MPDAAQRAHVIGIHGRTLLPGFPASKFGSVLSVEPLGCKLNSCKNMQELQMICYMLIRYQQKSLLFLKSIIFLNVATHLPLFHVGDRCLLAGPGCGRTRKVATDVVLELCNGHGVHKHHLKQPKTTNSW